jgi:GT2 family glycosyltransferase/predicted  nucleic acid-binding Zn-ribbon protein
MVAHALRLCGVYLGPDEPLSHSAFDNPDGFWEDAEFVKLNDDILGLMFGAWDAPPVFADDWETQPEFASLYRRATQLITQRVGNPIWGWKDPRCSLTLPFWLNLIPDLQAIICLRHPLEVAQSLERRNFLSIPFGLRLWYAYQARLLAATQPGNRLITHYDSYFADPVAEIRRVIEFLKVDVADADLAQAASICKKGLRNNRVDRQSYLGIPHSVTKLYQRMCAQAGPVYARLGNSGSGSEADLLPLSPPPSQPQPLLATPDHFASSAEESVSIDHVLNERVRAVLSIFGTEFSRFRDDIKVRDGEIERLREDVRTKTGSLERLSSEVAEANTQIRDLSAEIARQNTEICGLTGDVTQRDSEIRRVSGELEQCEQRLQHVTDQASAGEQEALRLHSEVASLSSEILRLGQELDSRCDEAVRATAELAARGKTIDTLRKEATDRKRMVNDLRWQILRLERQLKDVFQSRAWKAVGVLRRLKSLASDFTWIKRLPTALLSRLAKFRFLRRKASLAAPHSTPCGPATGNPLGASQTVGNPREDLAGIDQAVMNSPLFDVAWYREQYPDVAGRDPIVHYLTYGAWEGRNPHPLFDSRWYLEQYRDEVMQPGANPLSHFLRYGSELQCWPNPLFDTAWYLQQNPDVAAAGLNPLLHFVAKGCAEGRKPNPYFDPKWYLQQHPELAAANVNPLSHYLAVGEAAGFPPSPLFDPPWYARQCAAAMAGGFGPLAHYLHVGMKHNAAPNPAAAWVFADSSEVCAADAHAEQPKDPADPQDLRAIGSIGGGDINVPSNPLVFKREESPLVSIIVPVHNQWLFTLWCLRSIWATSGDVSYEVILADDASTDETVDIARMVQNITVLRNDPAAGGAVGFLKNCNRAAAIARGKYVLFLNNDTLIHAECLRALVQVAEQDPKAGLVGCKLLFADGQLQEAGGIVWQDASGSNYGRNDDPDLPEYNYLRETDYCSGAAILVRRDLWTEIGGFDERFAPAYYEDTDLAFEIRQRGYRVLYQPRAVVVHFEGASHGTDLTHGLKQHQVINRGRFLEKWKSVLQQSHYLPGQELFLARDRSRSGKHVLLIDWELPSPDCDSGSFRICNLMQILKSLGYRVTFVPANMNSLPSRLERLQQDGIYTVCGPSITSIEQFLANFGHHYQLVIVSRVNTASLCMNAIRRYCAGAFLIFDTVDLHFLREQRRADLEDSPVLRIGASETKKKELGFINQADLTLVVSPVECEILKREAPHAEVEIVSNIHPVHGNARVFQDRKDLLFIGGFRHLPNIDAVKWLVSDIFPELRERLPGVQLHIIGSDCPPDVQVFSGNDVNVLGYVPNLEPYLQQCRLTVVPLRYGAGVKGKINMSMRYGVPVVSTAAGVEGMFLRDGQDVMVADTPTAFVEAVCRVYEDQALWEKLSQAGLENVRRHFSFEVAEATLRGILQRISLPQVNAAA